MPKRSKCFDGSTRLRRMRKPLRILLTASGCPGASTLIRMLRSVREREVRIIGADIDDQAIGRFLCDDFHVIPPAEDPDYIEAMLDLVRRLQPNVLFSQSSVEVPVLSPHIARFEALGTTVPISPPEPIRIASDKHEMYETLRAETRISLPRYQLVHSLAEFRDAVRQLGYPERPVCFKPPVAKGSRGFRILDATVNRRSLLLDSKPNSRYMALEEFIHIFDSAVDFPALLVMEYLEGVEHTTDPIALDGDMLLCTTKTVETARWGVIVKGQLVDRPGLVEQTRQILRAIPLSYNVNIQFIGDKLIEINPRVSTFIYQEDLIAPYVAIQLALGEISPDEVRAIQTRVRIGRRMVRYMDQVFWNQKHTSARRCVVSPSWWERTQ